MSATKSLRKALNKYQLPVSEQHLQPLADYCDILWQVNKTLNLTRHTDFRTFAARDVLDTLQLLPFLQDGQSVLDVGSGGGVPGILLAILRPDLRITLAESVGKKAKALQTIIDHLSLPVAVKAQRAEAILKATHYDSLTVRAVANMRKLIFWFRTVPTAFDQMLLIKGPRWQQEFAEAQEAGVADNVTVTSLTEYQTPGHDGSSFVLSCQFGAESATASNRIPSD